MTATTVATALDRAVTIVPCDAAGLPAAHRRSPPRPDLILGLLALTLTDHLATAHRRLAAVNPAAHEPDLAMSLNNLSNRLAEARRNAEAEQAIQDPDELRTRSD